MKMMGKTILHYKILEKLGEGGMGVVYKARDTKLNREVAIKFLPHHIAPSEEERQRFKIEAQAAAALNHPNIATIHAVEEVDGETFIVMEYIKGRELKDIIHSNPPKVLNLRKVTEYAIQIAEGLQAAHEEGVIHRDIKSANIMITEKGQVKIMDFGLAKLIGGKQLTKKHATLGTAAYMSPEQAVGEDIDHRTDIWSFGVVFYELLTGRLPFYGEYDSAIIYSILNDEPATIKDIREDIPYEIEKFTYKCLQKDRENRYQSAEHLLFDLKKLMKNIEAGRSITKAVQPPTRARKRIVGFIMLAAALVLAVAFFIIGYNFFQQAGGEPKIVQARALTTTTSIQEFYPQISPDGSKVAYNAKEDGKWDLWVQQIASGQKTNLTSDHKSTVGGQKWSPDGNWIAFISSHSGGGIYVISEYGGAASRIVAHNFEDLSGGINWSPDGKKLVYTVNGKLYTVLASGGVPEHIPLPQYIDAPAWSPDGRRIVLISGASWSSPAQNEFHRQRIWTIRPDGSDAIAITDMTGILFTPFWAHDGKRIFFKWNRGGTRDIWWVPVDKNGKPTGSAKPLTTGLNTFDFSLSNDGSKLAYSTGGNNTNLWSLPLEANHILTMNDAHQVTHENQFIWNLTMSPDHEWLAFTSRRGGLDGIWLARKDGQELRRLTTDSSSHISSPSWSPDGSRIAFSSDQTGVRDIYMMPVDGGQATALTADSARDGYPSWSPDGKEIVFHSNRSGNFDLWMTSVSGGETNQLTDDQANDITPRYSPDGRFISFLSNRKGAWDLYLLPAGGGEPIQLTHLGATKIMGHVWSPDGKTIYLRHYDPGKDDPKIHIQAVAVTDGSMRKILDMEFSIYEGVIHSMATDGEKLYFIVPRPIGDIWLAELAYQ